MPGPHKRRRRDVPDYDGSYDPTDLGPGEQNAQHPQRREVPSSVRRVTSVPQQKPQPSPAPQKPPAPAPKPATPDTAGAEEASAQKFLILMVVSAVVLVICAVSLGIMLIRTASGKPAEQTASIPETLPATVPATELLPETEPPVTEPPETVPPATEPPETEPTETEPPETETERPRIWYYLYEDMLADEQLPEGYCYDLIDVDEDGVPELFVSEGDFSNAKVYIYTVLDERVEKIGEIKANHGELTAVPDEHEIMWTSGSWPSEFHVAGIEGGSFTETTNMTYQTEGDRSFTVNDDPVSIYEFCRKYSKCVNRRSIQHAGRQFPVSELEKMPQKAASRYAEDPLFDNAWWEDFLVEPTTERETRPRDGFGWPFDWLNNALG